MKLYSFAAMGLCLCLASPGLLAQQKQKNKEDGIHKKETVIIKKDGNTQTTVEIKNGDVYVNGEKVASTGDNNLNKKIVIDSDGDMDDAGFLKMWDSKAPRKAMLGVVTNAEKSGKGAYIQQVTPGSAAKDAGLKTGDVITKIDDKNIADPKALVESIESHQAGDKLSITYERDGKSQQTEATLSKMMPDAFARVYRNFRNPDNMDLSGSFPIPFAFDAMDGMFEPAPKLGITAEDRADDNGVRVLDVKPNSAAEKAGIQKDDVITKLGNENISSIDDLQNTLRAAKTTEKIKLQYQRNGKNNTTDIVLPRQTKKKDL